MPKSLGMRTACEWHRKQLLQACLRMDQHNMLQIKRGQILTTLTTSLTCDYAREDAACSITAMDTHLHHNPDNHQRPYPFHPGHYPHMNLRELQSAQVDKLPCSLLTWQLFTSCVKMLSHWSINCPWPSSKTTKIPMQYHLPTLPKGWVYEDDTNEVKQESLGSPAMELFNHPVTTPRVEGNTESER